MSIRRVVLAVWVAAFAIGTTTHLRALFLHGYLPNRFAPIGFNVFWTALTLIDPLVAMALVLQRRTGMMLALTVMLIDVTVNSYVVYVLDASYFSSALQLQTLFLGFVLGSFTWLWADPLASPAAEMHDVSDA